MQAVTYFKRALKLSRHYLSAWTLMGHEYVEMKNPPAAIGELRTHFNQRFVHIYFLASAGQESAAGNHSLKTLSRCFMFETLLVLSV